MYSSFKTNYTFFNRENGWRLHPICYVVHEMISPTSYKALWPLCVQSRNTVTLFASNVLTFLAKEINITQFILRDLNLVISVIQTLTHVDLVRS